MSVPLHPLILGWAATNLVDNILLVQHVTLHLVDPPPLLDHDGQQIAAAAGQVHGRKRLVLLVGAVNVDDALADALEQQSADLLGGAEVAEVGLERDPSADRHLRVDEADEGAQGRRLEDALEALEEAATYITKHQSCLSEKSRGRGLTQSWDHPS